MTNPANNKKSYIDRPPRIQPPLPENVVKIPPPPDKKGQNQSFVQILLPLISILGYSLVSVFGGGRNVWFMLPMAFAIIASSSYAAYSFLQERKRIRELTRAYANRLRMLRSDMEFTHQNQRLYYEYTHPQVDVVQSIGEDQSQSRIGARLWERRPTDRDFASLRLGVGDIESQVRYEFDNAGSVDEDPQISEAIQLAEDSLIVSNTPVIIPMLPIQGNTNDRNDVIPGRHSIGISGRTTTVMDVTRAYVMQLAAFHSPNDFHIHVLGAPQAFDRWGWAQWLPHTNNSDEKSGDRMCFAPPLEEGEDAKTTDKLYPKRFLGMINKEIEQRRLLLEEGGEEKQKQQSDAPFILLIIDNLAMNHQSDETTHWIDDLVSEPAINTILQRGQALRIGVMFLVPQNPKIPSDCQSVIEVNVMQEGYVFRYSEIGVNTPRYIGVADHIADKNAEIFAQAISKKSVRKSFGADLQRSVDILELFKTETVEDLPVFANWDKSKQQGKDIADWLRVEVGVKSGNDHHEIYFHQDYDGVHGMIAGTTGSGKSELLLTLIAGLAINYDPTILNFVLIDYKGGSAFKPFETLPHCVDIVTNLDGKAVDRMFVAIDAELKRRSGLLADYNVKHIVEYRQKGYHLTEEPFPHLFIVVDEFAEMINENKEYKSRFDSITRLGRAIGVNLILATQRPSGVVTDQMRANMKLRICLRVETGDDSRELLGRSDAMFLPSNIPGRAYFQAGKDTPNLLQVARAGGPYEPPTDDVPTEDVIFGGNRKKVQKDDDETDTIVDLIVERLVKDAKQYSEPQSKPWPDPLPTVLPLNLPVDATYLDTKRTTKSNKIVLNQMLLVWMVDQGSTDYAKAQSTINAWSNGELINWDASKSSIENNSIAPLKVPIGLIDFPSLAKQQIFTLDVAEGGVAIFGAAGWGKTIFLKTLILSLAAIHTPDDLWIYIMDFARGGLKDMAVLPHVDTTIDVVDTERVERLLRVLGNMIDDRTKKVRDAGGFEKYNLNNSDDVLPAVLVVIDNFAEFKETYESYIPQLTTIIRDGRSMGIYFVITADQVNAIPSKTFNQFTKRLTLKLSDSGDYQAIVGRAAGILTETPGRGAISIDREPREFHVGVIATPDDLNLSGEKIDYKQRYEALATRIANEWSHSPSIQTIDRLSNQITLQDLPDPVSDKELPNAKVFTGIGLRDVNRKTAWLTLNSHCLVLGTPASGKTTLLQTIIISLAQRYTPSELAFILIDPTRRLFDNDLINSNAQSEWSNLPHVLSTVSEPEEFKLLMQFLDAEFDLETYEKIKTHATENNININDLLLEQKLKNRQFVIIFDNYDDIEDLESAQLIDKIALMARKYRSNIHIIVSGTPEVARGGTQALIKRIKSARNALILGDVEAVKNLGGKTRFNGDLLAGRGFSLQSGKVDLLQVARLANDEDYFDEIDTQILELAKQYKHHDAQWYFQGSRHMLETILEGKTVKISTPEELVIDVDDDIDPEIAEMMQQILEESKKYEKKE